MLTWAWLWRGTDATSAQVVMKKTKRFIVLRQEKADKKKKLRNKK